MFKKIALFGAAACFTVTTVASAAGAYVGAGLGYQTVAPKVTGTDVDTAIAMTGTGTSTFHGDGALGQIFAGYGLCLGNNFWAALEINGELGSTTANSNGVITNTGTGLSQTQTDQVKLKGSYGVSFRPGYFTSDETKIYGVLGWQRGKFQYNGTEQTSNSTTIASGSQTQWANGFRFGAGMETNLTGQLGLRAEMTQTRYKSLANNYTALGVSNNSVKNTSNEAVVSLVWTIGDFAGLGGASS